MEISRKIDIEKHREKLIYLLLVAIFLALTLTLVYKPAKSYEKIKRELKVYEIKVRKEAKSLEVARARADKLEKTKAEEEGQIARKKEELEKNSFKDISEFERHIDEVATKISLEISAIGRIESIKENTKVYVPYVLSGELEDILKFFEDIEDDNMLMRIGETAFKVDTEKDKNSRGDTKKASFKITTNILNLKNDGERWEDIKLVDILKWKVKKISTLGYNEKEYVIVKYTKGGSQYFFVGEVISHGGELYELVLENGEAILKHTKK